MDYWEKIVLLRLSGSAAKALPIKSSKDAARILLKAWPTREGKSYRRAVLSCSAAVHGRVPQDLAQWAFIVAAMEAAMTYEIIDRFDTEIAAVCQELLQEEGLFAEYVEPASETAVDAKPLFETKPPVETKQPFDVRQPFWWPKRQASARSAR